MHVRFRTARPLGKGEIEVRRGRNGPGLRRGPASRVRRSKVAEQQQERLRKRPDRLSNETGDAGCSTAKEGVVLEEDRAQPGRQRLFLRCHHHDDSVPVAPSSRVLVRDLAVLMIASLRHRTDSAKHGLVRARGVVDELEVPAAPKHFQDAHVLRRRRAPVDVRPELTHVGELWMPPDRVP